MYVNAAEVKLRAAPALHHEACGRYDTEITEMICNLVMQAEDAVMQRQKPFNWVTPSLQNTSMDDTAVQ